MANVNNPFGFRPLMRTMAGGQVEAVAAHKLAGYGTALFINDAVTHAAAGTKPTACIDAAISPGSTPVLGVNLIWGAASTATDHLVVLGDGGAVFLTQGDGTGAIFLVPASLSLCAKIKLTAGNPSLKLSKHQLDESTLAITNTWDLKVRKLWESPDNVAAAFARVEVTFNNLVGADQKAGI
jgi:hypothetical protein